LQVEEEVHQSGNSLQQSLLYRLLWRVCKLISATICF
jgi:hypothetical protein